MIYEELKKKLDAAKESPNDINKIIDILKDEKNHPYPAIKLLKAEYDPSGHDVMNTDVRKLKPVYGKKGEIIDPVSGFPKPGEAPPVVARKNPQSQDIILGYEDPTRIALPFQWSITESRVNFAFGLPVTLECTPEDDKQKELYTVITKIRKKNKIDTVDRVFAREAHRATRAAEYWFFSPGETHSDYGKDLNGKIRCAVWQPFEGDDIYPFFDDFGDMIAFTRSYTIFDEEDKEVEMIDVFTSDFRYSFKRVSGTTAWGLTKEAIANPYKKIPVIFCDFKVPAWHYVRSPIARLETLVSDHADTNAYHASPKIFIKGKIQNFIKKGETGGVIQGDKDTNAEYLSWDRAPESTKLEAEMLMRFIYGFTNTPDMTFEQMAKMTNPSGETMKMLFMAAHLQVRSDSEQYNDWQERRNNLMKSIIAYHFKDLKDAASALEIEPKINPFMIDDTASKIENAIKANGGKPVVSRETSMGLTGLVPDVQKELELIKKEEKEQDDRDAQNFQRQNVSFE